MGKLRCQFKVFHKPIFGFKGSYVVTRDLIQLKTPFEFWLDIFYTQIKLSSDMSQNSNES